MSTYLAVVLACIVAAAFCAVNGCDFWAVVFVGLAVLAENN